MRNNNSIMVALCFVGPSKPQFDVLRFNYDSSDEQIVGIQIVLKVKSIRYTSGFCLILGTKCQENNKNFSIGRKNAISCKTIYLKFVFSASHHTCFTAQNGYFTR